MSPIFLVVETFFKMKLSSTLFWQLFTTTQPPFNYFYCNTSYITALDFPQLIGHQALSLLVTVSRHRWRRKNSFAASLSSIIPEGINIIREQAFQFQRMSRDWLGHVR
jgi:hypothetical protein